MPYHPHPYIIICTSCHLINWLQRFYRITMSLKITFVPKSEVKQWITTTTTVGYNKSIIFPNKFNAMLCLWAHCFQNTARLQLSLEITRKNKILNYRYITTAIVCCIFLLLLCNLAKSLAHILLFLGHLLREASNSHPNLPPMQLCFCDKWVLGYVSESRQLSLETRIEMIFLFIYCYNGLQHITIIMNLLYNPPAWTDCSTHVSCHRPGSTDRHWNVHS